MKNREHAVQMKPIERLNIGFYEIFLLLLIVLQFGGILYTSSYLYGAQMDDFGDLRANTIQTAALTSVNLPVYSLFKFLYGFLELPNDFIKALIALFALVIILTMIYKITIYVFDNRASGILAVILFLFSSLYFAAFFSKANFIDDSNPDALSYAFLMLAIFFWLKEKHMLAAVFAGLSFDCHPILALGFTAIFFTYLAISYKTVGFRNIVLAGLLFFITTLPASLGVLKAALITVKSSGSGLLDGELIWRYVRIVQPQTIFVNTDPRFKSGVALYFASFLLLFALYNSGDAVSRKKYLKLFFLVFAVFSMAIFDILNSYYFRIMPLFNLWLHRFMSYGSVINYMVLAGAVFSAAPREDRAERVFKSLLFLLLCASVLIQSYGIYAFYTSVWAIHFYLLEIVIIYSIYKTFSGERPPLKLLAVYSAFLMGALACFYYMALYNRFENHVAFHDLFRVENAALFLRVIFYEQFKDIVFFTSKFAVKFGPIQTILMFSMAFLVLYLYTFRLAVEKKAVVCGVILIMLSASGLYIKYKGENYKNSNVYLYDRPLAAWVKNNTLKTDEFLIPLTFYAWQESKRPVFYDKNVINAASYNKAFMMAAIKRFQVLMGLNLKKLSESEIDAISPIGKSWGGMNAYFTKKYNSLSEEDVRNISRDYNVKYFVTGSDKDYSFPVVYDIKKYRIYKLK